MPIIKVKDGNVWREVATSGPPGTPGTTFATGETMRLENGILSVNTAKSVIGGSHLPVTSDAVHQIKPIIVTINEETNKASHTSTQIIEHYNNGCLVVMAYDSTRILQLYSVYSNMAFFTATLDFGDGLCSFSVCVDSDGNVSDTVIPVGRKTFTATVGTNWSGSGPYTQSITVSGILDTDTPHIMPNYSSDNTAAIAQKEAWAMVSKAEAANNTITFTCFEEKPTTSIPITIEVIK